MMHFWNRVVTLSLSSKRINMSAGCLGVGKSFPDDCQWECQNML